MKTLGIVGGIGPESTIEYYRFILDGYRARVPEPPSPELLRAGAAYDKKENLVRLNGVQFPLELGQEEGTSSPIRLHRKQSFLKSV